MYSCFKLKIIAACALAFSFASAAKGQLASDKTFDQICNKKIHEKLAENNKSRQPFKLLKNEQNLASNQSTLKDVAKLKLKNSGIVSHGNSALLYQEKKNQLPSNSSKLKLIGKPAIKTPTLLSQ